MLKYIHKNGCDWDSDACAAKKRYLEVLKYAYDWDSDACAANKRYLEVLKYAYENGCN